MLYEVITDQIGQIRPACSLEPAIVRTALENTPRGHGVHETLEILFTKRLCLEQALNQIMRLRPDHDRVRFCDGLHARGKIGGFAHNIGFLGGAFSDQVANRDISYNFV